MYNKILQNDLSSTGAMRYYRKKALLESNGDQKGILKLQAGRYLQLLRKMIGLTQKQTAEKLGIARESWNRIESGKCLPTKRRIKDIASVLRASEEKLLELCGYFTDRDFPVYDEEKAYKDLAVAFKNAENIGEFIIDIEYLWNRHREVITGAGYEGEEKLRQLTDDIKHTHLNIPLAQTAIEITRNLSPLHLMQLIKEILIGKKSILIFADQEARKILEEISDELNMLFDRQ